MRQKIFFSIVLIIIGTNTLAQVRIPHQNFISAGVSTGVPHPSTSVPTHFSSFGQPMVMQLSTATGGGGGGMVLNDFLFTGETVTGIENKLNTIQLSFYPNPTERILKIKTPEKGRKDVRIYFSNGTLLKQFNFEGSETAVDVNGYLGGMYYFIITSEKGMATGKFYKIN